jgi:hypothetical protein
MNYRAALPVLLLLGGVAAAIGVPIADDSTWQSIWVGLSSTAITAGLVDGSALLEARARERAVLHLVGVRVGQMHQSLLRVIYAVFGISLDSASEVSARLRSLETEREILLEENVVGQVPPITVQANLIRLVRNVDAVLDTALDLGVLTAEASRVQRLDEALRHGHFMSVLRVMIPQAPVLGFGKFVANRELAKEAADAVDAVQAEFRFFARQGGKGWRYGHL